MIYCAAFGGFLSGTMMSLTYRRLHNKYVASIEMLWNEDIKQLRGLISEQERKISALKLSPNSVSKPVRNQGYFNKNKGKS